MRIAPEAGVAPSVHYAGESGVSIVDLAAIGSFVARDAASEAQFLAAYFGTPPTPAQTARMYLARQTNNMFYGMAMLATTGGVRPPQVRSLDDLHIVPRSGEPLLNSAVGIAEYALARIAAMVAGVDDPRFAQACCLAA